MKEITVIIENGSPNGWYEVKGKSYFGQEAARKAAGWPDDLEWDGVGDPVRTGKKVGAVRRAAKSVGRALRSESAPSGSSSGHALRDFVITCVVAVVVVWLVW